MNFLRRTERFNLSSSNEKWCILAVMWFSCLRGLGSSNPVASPVVNSKSWQLWSNISIRLSMHGVSQHLTLWRVADC